MLHVCLSLCCAQLQMLRCVLSAIRHTQSAADAVTADAWQDVHMPCCCNPLHVHELIFQASGIRFTRKPAWLIDKSADAGCQECQAAYPTRILRESAQRLSLKETSLSAACSVQKALQPCPFSRALAVTILPSRVLGQIVQTLAGADRIRLR